MLLLFFFVVQRRLWAVVWSEQEWRLVWERQDECCIGQRTCKAGVHTYIPRIRVAMAGMRGQAVTEVRSGGKRSSVLATAAAGGPWLTWTFLPD